MERKHLIVIGGDAAGMSGASQARKLNKDLKITIFEKEKFISYAA
jgi:NADPH-dependent 2,4-dienoyl-CoA reductase/sulfur reductase-like enzyme